MRQHHQPRSVVFAHPVRGYQVARLTRFSAPVYTLVDAGGNVSPRWFPHQLGACMHAEGVLHENALSFEARTHLR